MFGQPTFTTDSDNPYAPSEVDAQSTFGTTPYGEMTLTDVLFSFEGRIPRSTYWLTYFGSLAALTGVYLTAMLISEDLMTLTVFLSLIPAIWIGLAIEVKRWHDLGYSGFWVLLGLLPYLGGFIKLIMLGFMPSDDDNEYGPAPR